MAITISADTGCRLSGRASRTCTARARSWAPGAGAARRTPYGATSPRPLSGRRCIAQALPVENGGIASRDFIFVEDIARGLIACAARGEPGEAYNLASGVETTILDLARLINELTGNPTPIALAPARDWDRSGHRFGDPRKAREQLGFAAETALRDGLVETIAWTRANARHDPALHAAARALRAGLARRAGMRRFRHPDGRRRATAIRQGGGDLARRRGARRHRGNPAAYRPAFRRGDVARLLRRARDPGAADSISASTAAATAR